MLQCSTASKRVCFAHLLIEGKGYFSKKHFWSAMGMRLPHTVEPGGCFFRECPPWVWIMSMYATYIYSIFALLFFCGACMKCIFQLHTSVWLDKGNFKQFPIYNVMSLEFVTKHCAVRLYYNHSNLCSNQETAVIWALVVAAKSIVTTNVVGVFFPTIKTVIYANCVCLLIQCASSFSMRYKHGKTATGAIIIFLFI